MSDVQEPPSSYPSQQPSSYPSQQPSGYPSQQPSGYPSQQPSGYPSSQQPSGYPSSQQPSGYPSSYPSQQPSGYPSQHPSGYPSQQPAGYPSQQPSGNPSTSTQPQTGNGSPTDAASEQELASRVDQGQAQALAAAVAAGNGISAGFGSGTLVTGASDASQMSGEDVRAQCGAKCDLSETVGGEVFALVGCGDGTCPTCPPGLGNLIVKHWCAYVGVSSHRSAIVLHLLFGAKLGPFLV